MPLLLGYKHNTKKTVILSVILLAKKKKGGKRTHCYLLAVAE